MIKWCRKILKPVLYADIWCRPVYFHSFTWPCNFTGQIVFDTDFLGVFALLPNLHDSFSESGAKTTQTVYANIRPAQIILSELPPDIVIKKRDGQIVYIILLRQHLPCTHIFPLLQSEVLGEWSLSVPAALGDSSDNHLHHYQPAGTEYYSQS